MKRYITTIACATLLAGTALADDYPKFETFLGYNYVRFYPQSNVPAFSANGGSGQFVVNPRRWLGVVLDVGAVTNQNFAGFSATNTQLFFMGGPRFSLRRPALSRTLRPYSAASTTPPVPSSPAPWSHQASLFSTAQPWSAK